MLHKFSKLCVFKILFLWLTVILANDIRLVIDVSGSMKKTDPNNLRIPAIKLLASLIPPKDNGGIWLFSDYAEILVPSGNVNHSWKRKANLLSHNVHSRGRYTNLYQALLEPSKSWFNSPIKEGEKRILVLLSDGELDVYASKAKNKALRNKILFNLVPKLKKNHIQVYTIALSNRADKTLLREISLATDGLFQPIKTSNALASSFFNVFYAAIDSNTIPLKDSHFYVDNNVHEITLLLKSNHDKNFIIKTPLDDTLEPDNELIYQSKEFTFITIQNPMPGEWQIENLRYGNNLVLIYSNLLLETRKLDNNLFSGEMVNFSAHFANNQKKILDPPFLETFKVITKVGSAETIPLNLSTKQNAFKGVITIPNVDGNLIIQTIAFGKTLTRQKNQLISVHPFPFSMQLLKPSDEQWVLTIKENNESIKNISYLLFVQTSDSPKSRRMEAVFHNNRAFHFLPPCTRGYYTLTIKGSGTKKNGSHFSLEPQKLTGVCPDGGLAFTSNLSPIPSLKEKPTYQQLKTMSDNRISLLASIPKLKIKIYSPKCQLPKLPNLMMKKGIKNTNSSHLNNNNTDKHMEINPILIIFLIIISIIILAALTLLIQKIFVYRRNKLLKILEDIEEETIEPSNEHNASNPKESSLPDYKTQNSSDDNIVNESKDTTDNKKTVDETKETNKVDSSKNDNNTENTKNTDESKQNDDSSDKNGKVN